MPVSFFSLEDLRWMPWRQLLAMWVATPILAACLLWIDFAVSPEFFWLVPYPMSLGAIVGAAGPLFREALNGCRDLRPSIARRLRFSRIDHTSGEAGEIGP